MSLKDITKLALQSNLDIAISDTNEEIYGLKIRQAYGPYDPVFSFTPGVQSRQSPNTRLDTAAAAPFNQTDTGVWDEGYRQAISTGGTLTASLNSNRTDTNQAFALFNPQNSATWQVQFTQPLFRNFRIDQNRSTIKLANLDEDTSCWQTRANAGKFVSC